MDEHFAHSADYELLGKYLAGECTPDEAQAAEAWIAASPENKGDFEALKAIWEESLHATPADVDVDVAWHNVRQWMHGDDTEESVPFAPAVPERRNWMPLVRVAAMLVLAIGIVWVFTSRGGKAPEGPRHFTLESQDQPVRDTLMDGTVVTLNAHSRLRFPTTFGGAATRSVELYGEAFFDVRRNPSQPFVVAAQGTEVRVLGTSFNLRARAEGVRVAVLTGKVQFSAPTSPEAVVLAAGGAAHYDSSTRRIQRDSSEAENDAYWQTGRLVFRNRRLGDVAAELEAKTGKPVRLASQALAPCRLSATFEKQSIESILTVIAETFTLEVTQDEQGYLLKGEGCK